MVPIGMLPAGIALPGFTSTCSPENTGSAGGEPLWREDIGKLPVLVLDQSDEAGAVRVIFDALDLGRHIEFPALEVDVAIRLLVAATPKPHSDAAIVVASAGRDLSLGQRLDRRAAVESGPIPQHALALRDRMVGFECHGAAFPQRPVVTSMR